MISPPRLLDRVLPAALGLTAGGLAAAALVASGVARLDGLSGAVEHYALAAGFALLLGSFGRWGEGLCPRAAAVVVALLLAFALRRWLTVWVNLEPLGWRSGPAGIAPIVALPLEGLLLGVIVGVDARRTSRAAGEPGAPSP